MAIFRNIQMSFWTDTKVSEDFTPDERYMYLYLLTNPYTNLCGCYGLGYKQIAYDTGLDIKKVKNIIRSLQEEQNVIRYSEDNREILLLNWYKYNWTDSEKFRKPLWHQIEMVKTTVFKGYLTDLYNGTDTVSIPYEYGTDTTVTVTDTVENTVTDTVTEVVEYLNDKAGTKYKTNSKATTELIKARTNEGFTADDFKTVIDKKSAEWMGTEQEQYLRPETLFARSHFESYLNQPTRSPTRRDQWLSAGGHRDDGTAEAKAQLLAAIAG